MLERSSNLENRSANIGGVVESDGSTSQLNGAVTSSSCVVRTGPRSNPPPALLTSASSPTTISEISAGATNSQCNGDDEDDADDTWKEVDPGEELDTICLFCDSKIPLSTFLAHCDNIHLVDLVKFFRSLNDSNSGVSGSTMNTDDDLDYDFVRFVNYIREHRIPADRVVHLSAVEWRCDRYMQPVLEDDALLMLDISEFVQYDNNAACVNGFGDRSCSFGESAESGSERSVEQSIDNGDDEDDGNNDGTVVLSAVKYRRLLQRLHQAESQSQQLQLASANIQTMRRAMQRVVDDTGVSNSNELRQNCIDEGGSGYFESYSHYGIHHEMITDAVRTESYKNAIYRNSAECVEGRRVLDVGCGSGILSLFCARAGAASVVAVDASDVASMAEDVVRENCMESVIDVRHCRVEQLCLQQCGGEKFDVIVSEWMGYLLLFEGMLESVLWSRDHLLAAGGVIMPNRCTISIRAVCDTERYNHMVDMWSDVHDFKMTCFRRAVLREACVEIVPEHVCCSQPALLHTVDIYTASIDQASQFDSPFSLIMERDAAVTSLVGYFDVMFDLTNPVSFSCSPGAKSTHWKQTVFYLPQPISVNKGDILTGSFFCAKSVHDSRNLRVVITLAGNSHIYTVS